ncbi:MAG: 2-dehydropantoate 2-reductase, partial [Anaerolineae bacterium]|nr:2-dehydropantoate 2-reductase [Anaerolineae bacterium]
MNHNPESSPRILLMGCGAVGGVIGAGLLESGHDVTLVTHNTSISRTIVTHGLRVVTPDGTHTLSPKRCAALTHPDLTAVAGSFDIVLLAMKASGVEAAARGVLPMLAPDGIVVTLQNGIVEDHVASIIGRERAIGALVGWGATMHGPGIYERTSRGEMTIGELNGSTTERIQRLKTVLDAVAPTAVSANIYGALWSKLAINCVVTTLGATTGQLLGQMLRQARVRRLALSVISEVMDVAAA